MAAGEVCGVGQNRTAGTVPGGFGFGLDLGLFGGLDFHNTSVTQFRGGV